MRDSRKSEINAEVRHFAPEADLLLKARLLRYKRRTRKTSIDAVALELNDWPEIERWFPKAFSPRAKPIFTRRMLDTWISGDTTPKGSRLTIIAEFLIQKAFLSERDLQPDEKGFGVAQSLYKYLNPFGSDGIPDWSGEYESYSERENAIEYNWLSVHLDTKEDVTLFRYTCLRAFQRNDESKVKLRQRLDDGGDFVERSSRQGWGTITQNQAITFMRRPTDTRSHITPWLWELNRASSPIKIGLISADDRLIKISPSIIANRDHHLPVMKKLTISSDISYHLERRGGYEQIFIRNIMKDQTVGGRWGELTDLDREFLRAARRADPEPMVAALNSGADINAVDPETGLTALIYAAKHGVSGVVKILADRPDLNPSVTDQDGRPASELILISRGDIKLIERLIDLEATYDEMHLRPSSAPSPKGP